MSIFNMTSGGGAEVKTASKKPSSKKTTLDFSIASRPKAFAVTFSGDDYTTDYSVASILYDGVETYGSFKTGVSLNGELMHYSNSQNLPVVNWEYAYGVLTLETEGFYESGTAYVTTPIYFSTNGTYHLIYIE